MSEKTFATIDDAYAEFTSLFGDVEPPWTRSNLLWYFIDNDIDIPYTTAQVRDAYDDAVAGSIPT